MKTMKKITLTAVLIILTANVTLANNYRTSRMQASTMRILEIISFVEAPVKEIIPGYESFVAELWKTHTVVTKDIAFYNESEVANDYPEVIIDRTEEYNDTNAATARLLASISEPEDSVDDLTINTREIYEELMAEKEQKNREQTLSLIHDLEKEQVEEYYPVFQNLNIARAK